MPQLEHFDQFVRFFKVLGEPQRLRIVGLLAQSPHTVEQIAKTLKIGVSTVSHHLSRLSDAGLVSAKAKATTTSTASTPTCLEIWLGHFCSRRKRLQSPRRRTRMPLNERSSRRSQKLMGVSRLSRAGEEVPCSGPPCAQGIRSRGSLCREALEPDSGELQ